MALIVIRTVIIFVTLVLIMRLMGKRQIGEMQPFELVITLIIADLACIPMADSTIPLLYGVVAILSIFVLHQIICLLDLKWKPFKAILSGQPSIVITPKGIDVYRLRQNNMDVSDLIESIRGAGYFSLAAVKYGIYESNGQFSALPNENFQDTSLPVLIVNNGQFDSKNVALTGKDEAFFRSVLRERSAALKDVFVLTTDSEGNCYLQENGKEYQIFRVELGGQPW